MKQWNCPEMKMDYFLANEYVSACGDSGVVYNFECNTPAGNLYVYVDANEKVDGNYTGLLDPSGPYGYEDCYDTYEAESSSAFFEGFVDQPNAEGVYNGICDSGEKAIVWLEGFKWDESYSDGWVANNVHATNKLDMNTWETAKS